MDGSIIHAMLYEIILTYLISMYCMICPPKILSSFPTHSNSGNSFLVVWKGFPKFPEAKGEDFIGISFHEPPKLWKNKGSNMQKHTKNQTPFISGGICLPWALKTMKNEGSGHLKTR